MSVLTAETLKLRTTRTSAGLGAALAGIITLAAVVHVLGFDRELLVGAAEQRRILSDIGVTMGLTFAALSGALAITGEHRHGTLRSTVLKQPGRVAVLRAKAATQAAAGALIGAAAAGYATALTAVFLSARDLHLALDVVEVGRLVAGTAAGGAACALVGLAIGTMVRNQVPVVVGIPVWTLFIESLLRAGLPSVGRFVPGSLGRAIAAPGDGVLASAPVAAAVLAAVAAALLGAAGAAFARRDIG